MSTIPPVVPASVAVQRGEGMGNTVSTPGGDASAAAKQAAQLAQAATDPLIAALHDALAAAAPRQNGLAQVFAELQSLAARPDLPPQVRAAVQALLALRLDVAAITPETIAKALQQSGLYLEAQLAAQHSPGADLKLALVNLRSALNAWLGDAPVQRNETQPAPPPPYRGAPPAAQSVSVAQGAALTTPDAAQIARVAIEAALARHTMLQAASLPEQAAVARPGEPQQRLVFDIPLLTPQGTAVVQLQIERDAPRKGNGQGDAAAPVWRLAFSVDIAPAGPVHARIAQLGARTHVSLTAERADSAQALRGHLGELKGMLVAAALEPGDLVCHVGQPQPAAASAAPGLFVDRAT
jgi:hypothetical protein